MTVAAGYAPAEYAGDGLAHTFPFAWPLLAADHLVVELTAGGVTTPLVRGVDYLLNWIGSGATGSVRLIYMDGGTPVNKPPAFGETVTISRNTTMAQETNLRNKGPFLAETVERGIDRQMMVSQEKEYQASVHGNSHLPGGANPIDWSMVHGRGVLAERPEAGPNYLNCYYYATDVKKLYQCNGASWVELEMPPGPPGPPGPPFSLPGTGVRMVTAEEDGAPSAQPNPSPSPAGNYGAANKTLAVTVDLWGRITAIAASAIAITQSQVAGLVDALAAIWTAIGGLVRRDRNALNVRDYLDDLGWVNDGSSQPLSDFFATLAAAQAVFPNAAALTDEIAGVAIQHCINLTQPASTFRGGKVRLPHGSYRVNKTISLTAVTSVEIEGDSAVWHSYTGIYGGWPNKNMPGTSRILWTGTGSLFSFTDQPPSTGIPTKGLSFVRLVFNVDNQTEDIFTADGGTGIFFEQCYFGGGNKQLNYVANTPFDFYFNKCYFGTSLNDTQPNYGLYVDAAVTGFGGQSTIFNQCTMRYMRISHVRCVGPAQVKFNSCTLEGTAVGPSVHMDTPSAGCALYFYNCHWEQIFTSAYWNGTYWQYSSGDATRASVIRAGTAASSVAAFISVFQSDMNLRVVPGLTQVHAFLLYGAVRLTFQDSGINSLERALIYNYDRQRTALISRIIGSYWPSNGDSLIDGPDATRKSLQYVDIVGLPASSSVWSGMPTTYATRNASWTSITMSAIRGLMHWSGGWQAPVYPLDVIRELLVTNPADIGGNFDAEHAPFKRGDIIKYKTWRTGTAQNGGYGTRIGMYCGKDAAASNTADSWFPLITGPGLSGDVGNNNLTWNHRDFTEQWYNTPLTAEKTLTIANWAVEPNGARLRVIRTAAATGAFDLIIYSNKDAAELIRLRAGQWAEFMFTGSSWKLMASGPVELSATAEFEWRRPMKWVTATAAATPGANEVTVGAGAVKVYVGYYVGADQVVGARQAVGAALAAGTAGATYGATEQGMLQAAYDRIRTLETAMRTHGLLKD